MNSKCDFFKSILNFTNICELLFRIIIYYLEKELTVCQKHSRIRKWKPAKNRIINLWITWRLFAFLKVYHSVFFLISFSFILFFFFLRSPQILRSFIFYLISSRNLRKIRTTNDWISFLILDYKLFLKVNLQKPFILILFYAENVFPKVTAVGLEIRNFTIH